MKTKFYTPFPGSVQKQHCPCAVMIGTVKTSRLVAAVETKIHQIRPSDEASIRLFNTLRGTTPLDTYGFPATPPEAASISLAHSRHHCQIAPSS